MAESRIWSIAHLRASNFVGGPEKQILAHLMRLNREKFSGTLISFVEAGQPNALIEQANAAGINTIGLPQPGGIGPGLIMRLLRILRENRIDVLCMHDYKSAILGVISGKLAQKKLVCFYRGRTRENVKVRLLQSVEDRLDHFIDARVAVSRGELARIARKPSVGRDFVVHNGISLDRVSASPDRLEALRIDLDLKGREGPILLTAGRLSPEKGPDLVIRAMPSVLQAHPSCRLVICGDGQMLNDLERLAVKLDVAHAVRLAGFRPDLSAIMDLIDLLVLPSRSEGFPNVVLEAMAARKPVVAACVGGVPEAIRDGETGILVTPESPEALSAGIVGALASRDKLGAMATAGHEYAVESFSLDAQTLQLEEIYKQVLGLAPPAIECEGQSSLDG